MSSDQWFFFPRLINTAYLPKGKANLHIGEEKLQSRDDGWDLLKDDHWEFWNTWN